jgi:hypothetical protein
LCNRTTEYARASDGPALTEATVVIPGTTILRTEHLRAAADRRSSSRKLPPREMIGVRQNAVSIVAHAFRQAGLVSDLRGHIEIKGCRRVTEDVLRVLRAGPAQCERLPNTTG